MCVVCKVEFAPRSNGGRLCSKTCRAIRRVELAAAYQVKHRDRLRDRRTALRYGVTPEDMTRMLREQDYSCAICAKSPFKPIVDHCHDSGKVRALLCHHCNLVLGHARDNPDVLVAAANYLHSFAC